jgi:hypothetical protein
MFKTPKEPIYDLKVAEQILPPIQTDQSPRVPSNIVARIRTTKQALAQKLAFLREETKDLESQDRELLQRCIEQDRGELEQLHAEAQKQLDETNRILLKKTKLLAILNNQMDQPHVKDLANQTRRLTEWRDSLHFGEKSL